MIENASLDWIEISAKDMVSLDALNEGLVAGTYCLITIDIGIIDIVTRLGSHRCPLSIRFLSSLLAFRNQSSVRSGGVTSLPL